MFQKEYRAPSLLSNVPQTGQFLSGISQPLPSSIAAALTTSEVKVRIFTLWTNIMWGNEFTSVIPAIFATKEEPTEPMRTY